MTLALKHCDDGASLSGVNEAIKTSDYCNSSLKRWFDVVASLVALLLLSPFLLLIACLVKITSKGPVFYGHDRCGQGSKRFKCWKFRTMVVDAKEQLNKVLQDPEIAAEWKLTQKLKNDPRVTPIGLWLRKLSIDELPQIWNILIGDMSIVGPRPITESELSRYGDDVVYYLSASPGLTGPWQVGGRSTTTYAQRVAYDKDYVKEASFLGDIVLIFKTVGVLFGDRSAM